MVAHQLIGSSVFDRTGHLLGKVSRVDPLAEGDFSLVVALSGDNANGGEIVIGNRHLKAIDSQQKVIQADLDQQQLAASAGHNIQLLEERLVVNRKRNKVGEISVRKVIETEIVEIPIRREKLVIEKVGESEPLVEVGLGETRIQSNGISELEGAASSEESVVSGQFLTIRDSVSFLNTIARLPNHGCRKFRIVIFLNNAAGMETTLLEFESPDTAVRVLSGIETYLFQRCSSVYIDLLLSDPEMTQTYQNWFAEYAKGQVSNPTA